MKVLVLGSGGREHALTHSFLQHGHTAWCFPGNPGTDQVAPLPASTEGLKLEANAIADFAAGLDVDLVVIGPEALLAQGFADVLTERGLNVFGPSKEAARLETSKAWSKDFMRRYHLPTADYALCQSKDEALAAVQRFADADERVVIKPSGLTAGKGVQCCESLEEAKTALREIMDGRYGRATDSIVIEEMLQGPEISVLALCDGKQMHAMLPAQDHKRLKDDGLGPNTGGMGAYAPVPFVDKQLMQLIEDTIVAPTQRALDAEGVIYKGILYFGLMLTEQGFKILEFNCRFGDPEAQAVLPLLESDLAQHMLQCCKGKLVDPIRWRPQSACCVVLASKGYPSNPRTGDVIEGLETLEGYHDLAVFHAGTSVDSKGRVCTAGGRVLGVTGIGDNLDDAIAAAYAAVRKISFPGMQLREDIGSGAQEILVTR